MASRSLASRANEAEPEAQQGTCEDVRYGVNRYRFGAHREPLNVRFGDEIEMEILRVSSASEFSHNLGHKLTSTRVGSSSRHGQRGDAALS